MSKINLYTKNGGVSATSRKLLQGAVNSQLRDGSLTELLETTEKDNVMVVEIAESERGEIIYGTLTIGVSTVHPDNKPKPVRKKKDSEPVEVETFKIG